MTRRGMAARQISGGFKTIQELLKWQRQREQSRGERIADLLRQHGCGVTSVDGRLEWVVISPEGIVRRYRFDEGWSVNIGDPTVPGKAFEQFVWWCINQTKQY